MSLRGIGISAVFHVFLALLVVFGMPNMLTPDEILYQPQVISVDLQIAPVANAPNRTPKPAKKPEAKPKPKPAPKIEREPVKKPEPPKKAEPKPTPAPPKEKPKPDAPKEKPKKDPPKKEEPAKDEPSLDDILSSIEKTTPDKPAEEQAEKGEKLISDVPYDPSRPASQTVVDSIRNQIMKCWNYQGGAKEQENLVAHLRVIFREDGSIIETQLRPSDSARYNTDAAFRALVDSARRATRNSECVPLKGLPRGEYTSWSKMELVFKPGDIW